MALFLPCQTNLSCIFESMKKVNVPKWTVWLFSATSGECFHARLKSGHSLDFLTHTNPSFPTSRRETDLQSKIVLIMWAKMSPILKYTRHISSLKSLTIFDKLDFLHLGKVLVLQFSLLKHLTICKDHLGKKASSE